MKYSADPIICHRMVWYNFLYHVDRKYEILATLSAWATDVLQPYLQRHAPQFLAINTLENTWNDYVQGDHDVMDIDSAQWKQGGSKKKFARSTSPPLPTHNSTMDNPSTKTDSVETPVDAQHFTKETPTAPNPEEHDILKDVKYQGVGMTTDRNKSYWSSHQSIMSEASSTGKQSALQTYLNVPTNDGTYRVTFRWTPQGDFNNYNENSTTWLEEVYTLMTDLFSDSDSSFYHWESTDLTMSSVISELSPGELRDFLSPKIAFLPSTSQIIFGARICFAAKFPSRWRNKDLTRQLLKVNHVSLQISNSTTKSGKIVTAGYILFEAAKTTHRTRF